MSILKEIGCDSYSASAHKWMMGPLEAGVLFVRADRIPSVWPSIVTAGWTDHLKGARKLEVYGQRDDPRIVALESAVDFAQLIGMGAIESRMRFLATSLKEQLSQIGGRAPEDQSRAGAFRRRSKGRNHPRSHQAGLRRVVEPASDFDRHDAVGRFARFAIFAAHLQFAAGDPAGWRKRSKLWHRSVWRILNPTGRFSSRVDDYSRYRPSYPAEIVPLLEHECGLEIEFDRGGCRLGYRVAVEAVP